MYGALSMVLFLYVIFFISFFFFKQKTAYEMRISDWSSDVCSSDLSQAPFRRRWRRQPARDRSRPGIPSGRLWCRARADCLRKIPNWSRHKARRFARLLPHPRPLRGESRSSDVHRHQLFNQCGIARLTSARSEEHTSELQSLMRISYAVFCLKKKKQYKKN